MGVINSFDYRTEVDLPALITPIDFSYNNVKGAYINQDISFVNVIANKKFGYAVSHNNKLFGWGVSNYIGISGDSMDNVPIRTNYFDGILHNKEDVNKDLYETFLKNYVVLRNESFVIDHLPGGENTYDISYNYGASLFPKGNDTDTDIYKFFTEKSLIYKHDLMNTHDNLKFNIEKKDMDGNDVNTEKIKIFEYHNLLFELQSEKTVEIHINNKDIKINITHNSIEKPSHGSLVNFDTTMDYVSDISKNLDISNTIVFIKKNPINNNDNTALNILNDYGDYIIKSTKNIVIKEGLFDISKDEFYFKDLSINYILDTTNVINNLKSRDTNNYYIFEENTSSSENNGILIENYLFEKYYNNSIDEYTTNNKFIDTNKYFVYTPS